MFQMHRFVRNDFQRDAGESLPKFLAAVFAKKCGNRRACGNRETLLRTGSVTGGREVYDVTFKVWSTVNRTTGLFFRATGTDEWELISCYAGELDVIESRFYADGDYAIAVGW